MKDLLTNDNAVVNALMPTVNHISDIMLPIEADICGADQLNMVGVEGICEAISSGHTVKEICTHLGLSVIAFKRWQDKLPIEDIRAINESKVTWYESLETICQAKMLSITKIGEDLDEDDATARDRLELRNKALQNIEKVIKAIQPTLTRLQAKNAEMVEDKGDVYVTQMIVSEEWLAALPDE